MRLDKRACFKHFARFALGGLGNESTAIGFQVDKPVMAKRLQRGADYGATDAVDRSNFIFRQFGTRGDLVGDDRIAQANIDGVQLVTGRSSVDDKMRTN